MGALIARGMLIDPVDCDHGAPRANPPCPCCDDFISTTGAGVLAHSMDVFVEGIGAVRLGDMMAPHMRNHAPVETFCATHEPACDMASTTVFVNGKGVAREGDTFDSMPGGHTIGTPLQSTVFAG